MPQPHSHLPDKRSFGDRLADHVAGHTGSWPFIIIFNAVTALYALGQTAFRGFDPYPFVLYILIISVLAIDMSALILLSQNRQSTVDRAHAEMSYRHQDVLLTMQQEQSVMLGPIRQIYEDVSAIKRKLADIETALEKHCADVSPGGPRD